MMNIRLSYCLIQVLSMSRLGAPGAVLPLLAESQTEVPNLFIFYNFHKSLHSCSIIATRDLHLFIFISKCNASNNLSYEQFYSSTCIVVALDIDLLSDSSLGYQYITPIHSSMHCHDSCRVPMVNLCQLQPMQKDCWTHKTRKMS